MRQDKTINSMSQDINAFFAARWKSICLNTHLFYGVSLWIYSEMNLTCWGRLRTSLAIRKLNKIASCNIHKVWYSRKTFKLTILKFTDFAAAAVTSFLSNNMRIVNNFIIFQLKDFQNLKGVRKLRFWLHKYLLSYTLRYVWNKGIYGIFASQGDGGVV